VRLAIAVALVGAACSTSGGGSDTNVLRYAVQMETQLSGHLDPAESTNGCDNIVMHWVYGSLTDIDATGNPVPGLAESWELEGRVFTLHLRPGLTFHDGSPFDAEAVKKGIEYLKQGEQTGEALRVVDEVEVVDDLTVRFLLEDDTGGVLPLVLSQREGMIVAPKSIAAESADDQPVGAGPYTFEAFEPGRVISLRPFKKFYDPELVTLPGIDFVQAPTGSAGVNALLAGDLDVIIVQEDSLERLERQEDIGVATAQPVLAAPNYVVVQFRTGVPPFDNPLLRMAVNYAIDRDEINDAVFLGRGQIAWMPFPEGTPSNDPTVIERYPHDPDRARELLEEAGMPDGFAFDLYSPGGGIPFLDRTAELVQQQLKEVGIKANIKRVTDIPTEYYVQRQGNAFLHSRPAQLDAPGQVIEQWGTGRFVAAFNGAENAELTDLATRARSTRDPAEFASLMHQAAATIVDDALEAPIVFTPRNIAWDETRVAGDLRAPPGSCTPVELAQVTLTKNASKE
jgi:peptide/nickel transport system substrate-binding protein